MCVGFIYGEGGGILQPVKHNLKWLDKNSNPHSPPTHVLWDDPQEEDSLWEPILGVPLQSLMDTKQLLVLVIHP